LKETAPSPSLQRFSAGNTLPQLEQQHHASLENTLRNNLHEGAHKARVVFDHEL